MADPQHYPTFSPTEMTRRIAAVRARMEEDTIVSLVVYGAGRSHDVQYLTNWPGTRESYLVFPREGDPTLLVQLSNHLPNARRTATVDDVRWGGVDSPASVADVLRQRGLDRGRIGLVGPVPWQHHAKLAGALPDVEWVDAGRILREVRLVKSTEEIERIRVAARFTDMAMAALERELRPGLREDQLASIVESGYAREGGTHGIHFMATTPMRAPEIGVPSQIPSDRVIQRGDVLITEISADHWGYSGQIHRSYAVGEPPTEAYRRMHDAAVECYERVAGVLRDGATAADVVDAAAVVHERGYTLYDDLFHGISQLPPILRTRKTAHGPVPDFTFRADMVVVVQPNVVTEDARMGMQVGETLRITRTGVERLHAFPMRFVVCG
ncbi:MAG: aminopeptidase P family protein [Chloroflexota bacterium]|nr:aminopeptidase P family protein [Chloroflexota bacterium]MDE3194061.1 aminopeptidase P family protein [Chloroflexota bacterium]